MCYIDSEKRKNNRPQGVDQIIMDRNSTLATGQVYRGGFSMPSSEPEKSYLRLLKIKVSNARTNIPNVMRSLKSKFIRTTSPLMYDGEANALAVTRLFSWLLFYHAVPVSAIILSCFPVCADKSPLLSLCPIKIYLWTLSMSPFPLPIGSFQLKRRPAALY